ncbi:hypothetical protein ACI8AC_13100 [Geodermatophilus sp. SYSU D00758]
MPKKIVIAAAAGALALTGLAVAAPALAEEGAEGTAAPSVVDRIRDALSGLVPDGSLTAEQADEVAGTLAESGSGQGGRGGHGGPGLAAAAEALGMDADELHSALAEDGATLGSVAVARGVDVGDLVAALVDDVHERLAGAVEEGRLTQEQADERLADLGERVRDRVAATLPDRDGDRAAGAEVTGD